jgi:hypothetical protein
LFHILAPVDDVGPDDRAQLVVVTQPGARDEFPHVGLVGPARFRVGEVREPFLFGRHIGKTLELRARQRLFFDRNQLHRLDPLAFPVKVLEDDFEGCWDRQGVLQQLGMAGQKLQHRLLDEGLHRDAAHDSGELELAVCRLGDAHAELGPGIAVPSGRQIGKASGPNAFRSRIWAGFARNHAQSY